MLLFRLELTHEHSWFSGLHTWPETTPLALLGLQFAHCRSPIGSVFLENLTHTPITTRHMTNVTGSQGFTAAYLATAMAGVKPDRKQPNTK